MPLFLPAFALPAAGTRATCGLLHSTGQTLPGAPAERQQHTGSASAPGAFLQLHAPAPRLCWPVGTALALKDQGPQSQARIRNLWQTWLTGRTPLPQPLLKNSVLWQVAGQEARRDRAGVQHPPSTEEEPEERTGMRNDGTPRAVLQITAHTEAFASLPAEALQAGLDQV